MFDEFSIIIIYTVHIYIYLYRARYLNIIITNVCHFSSLFLCLSLSLAPVQLRSTKHVNGVSFFFSSIFYEAQRRKKSRKSVTNAHPHFNHFLFQQFRKKEREREIKERCE